MMLKFKSQIAVVLGLLVAISSLSFHYFIQQQIDVDEQEYMAIYPAKNTYISYDESIMYWPKITSFLMGGKLNSADPYLSEHKEKSTHVPFVAEYVVSLVVGVLKLDTNTSAIVVDIISISAIYFILYIFINSVSQQQIIPVVLSLLFIFSFDIFLLLSLLPSVDGILGHFTIGDITVLSRTTNISITIIPLLIFTFFYYQLFFEGNKDKTLIMFSSSAILAYFNVYMWTFSAMIIFFSYIIKQIYDRELLFLDKFKSLLLPMIVWLIILIPYFVMSYMAYSQVEYQDYLSRFGVADTNSPHVLTIGYISAIIVLHYIYTRYKLDALLVLMAIIATFLVLKNIQVILGYTVQAFHWSRDAGLPFVMLLTILYIAKKNIAVKIIFPFLFVSFMSLQYSALLYAENNSTNHIVDKKEYSLLEYISSNTLPSDVIAVPWGMSSIVLNHSKRRVYIPHAPVTFARNAEIIDRVVGYYCMVDIDRKSFRSLLDGKYAYYNIYHMQNVYHPSTYSYIFHRDTVKSRRPYLKPAEKDSLVSKLSLCKHSSSASKLNYKVDYLVIPNGMGTDKNIGEYEYEAVSGFKVYVLK